MAQPACRSRKDPLHRKDLTLAYLNHPGTPKTHGSNEVQVPEPIAHHRWASFDTNTLRRFPLPGTPQILASSSTETKPVIFEPSNECDDQATAVDVQIRRRWRMPI
jgi:hypothetical protein